MGIVNKPKGVSPPIEEDYENELLESLERGASPSEMDRRVAVARDKLLEMMAPPAMGRSGPDDPPSV